MSNIRSIHTKRERNEHIIDALRKALVCAEAGDIDGLVIITHYADRTYGRHVSWGAGTNLHGMVGALEGAKMYLIDTIELDDPIEDYEL